MFFLTKTGHDGNAQIKSWLHSSCSFLGDPFDNHGMFGILLVFLDTLLVLVGHHFTQQHKPWPLRHKHLLAISARRFGSWSTSLQRGYYAESGAPGLGRCAKAKGWLHRAMLVGTHVAQHSESIGWIRAWGHGYVPKMGYHLFRAKITLAYVNLVSFFKKYLIVMRHSQITKNWIIGILHNKYGGFLKWGYP